MLKRIHQYASEFVSVNFPNASPAEAIMLAESFIGGFRLYEEIKPSIYDEIIEIVCRYYGHTYDQVNQKNRKKELVMTRHICMFMGSTYTKLSEVNIGKKFNKDRTTVIHSCKVVNNLIETDKKIAYDIKVISNKIKTLLI